MLEKNTTQQPLTKTEVINIIKKDNKDKTMFERLFISCSGA